MPGLVPGIQFSGAKTWMAGTSPAMTIHIWEASGLRHPHRAHHEGRDVIAHALLLAALRLGGIALRPLRRRAMHDMAAFALALMLMMGFVRLVPRVFAMLVPPLLAVAVLRRRWALGAGRWLSLRLALDLGLVRGAVCLRAGA